MVQDQSRQKVQETPSQSMAGYSDMHLLSQPILESTDRKTAVQAMWT
jgi:hypothetical protein